MATTIGLLSDTHSYLDEKIMHHLQNCDAIWHAGDFGNINIANKLAALKPLRGVYGNIDGNDIRMLYPEINVFFCEQVKVVIKHIGGYPGKYEKGVKELLIAEKPQLLISGHSHILKIMYDEKLQCLHINPGAAGLQGWHKQRTLVRFIIDGAQIKNCEVIEIKNRMGNYNAAAF